LVVLYNAQRGKHGSCDTDQHREHMGARVRCNTLLMPVDGTPLAAAGEMIAHAMIRSAFPR